MPTDGVGVTSLAGGRRPSPARRVGVAGSTVTPPMRGHGNSPFPVLDPRAFAVLGRWFGRSLRPNCQRATGPSGPPFQVLHIRSPSVRWSARGMHLCRERGGGPVPLVAGPGERPVMEGGPKQDRDQPMGPGGDRSPADRRTAVHDEVVSKPALPPLEACPRPRLRVCPRPPSASALQRQRKDTRTQGLKDREKCLRPGTSPLTKALGADSIHRIRTVLLRSFSTTNLFIDQDFESVIRNRHGRVARHGRDGSASS
jgi:hypothetical protein